MAAPVTPTLAQLTANIQSQIEAAISQATPMLPKSFVRVLSAAIAAVVIVLYKYVQWIFRQMFPSTADFEETDILGQSISPLKALGNLNGTGDPLTGTAAQLLFDVTVTNQTGSLPIQTQIINSSSGVVYLTTSSVLLNAATIQAPAVAASDPSGGNGVGVVGNADDGTVMQFVNPLANVVRDVVVNSTTVQGANAETEAQYRDRVDQRFRNRPQGGAGVDYVVWGETVAGIESILPYTGLPGQVNVYVEATEASSGSPDGFPTQAQLDAVSAAIEFDDAGLASRRPLGAFVNVLSITRTAFNVTVVGLAADDIASVQAQIQTTLNQFFKDLTPFIPGVTPTPRQDIISPTTIIAAIEDVVTANNGIFTDATVALTSLPLVPLTLFALGEGEKAKLNIPVSYS